MVALLFLGSLGLRRLYFEPTPPKDQVELGRKVCRDGAGPDRTLMADKAVMGTWFDGRIRRAVDTATLVGPDMVARWLGYLAEQEAWSASEIQERWAAARENFNHSLTFVVRLAAFPKLDPLEYGSDSPPKPESLEDTHFKISFHRGLLGHDEFYLADGDRYTLQAKPIQRFEIEKYDSEPISGRPFYSLTALAPLFMTSGQKDTPDDGIALGDYYGAIYVVSFPTSKHMFQASEIELTVQLKTKREHARFAMRQLREKSAATNSTETL